MNASAGKTLMIHYEKSYLCTTARTVIIMLSMSLV